MGAPDDVLELVERFERNRDQYLNPAYNETQVRREFIDPFFVALGWDVDNRAGYAQQYKDVVHEDAIKVGVDARAPDYSFRVGGVRKFFVEAKKPAVNLKVDPAPAFQLRRYAWSAKLPLSVLTDFQELAVYDCRVKPAASDMASVARTLYVPIEQYESRWDEIAEVFGKDAVYKGSFDRYAESAKAKKGTAEVDKAFLDEIELWRNTLARNIALRNPSLSQRELNYAVQATIDRIIFLRICEDRGIEAYGRLQELARGSGIYARLRQLFVEADQRYNSGLFHFETERGRGGYPDRVTPTLSIDDKALRDILRRLYYPESPYEFSVLPADILGQVYEQFLGKVIRLTAGHRAIVEDKPEVKKAGGVYYTPTYIVDYIVESTVGRLLEGRTPKQASELRILDPACGSGSFLIGAYQHLVDWHRDWYMEHGPEKHRKQLHQDSTGEWGLTTTEKKRILLNNIFGVDIDAQAVETTKLSLLLKVLEGETGESLDSQLSFLRDRALPDLSDNIKCGNSLIGSDFYEIGQLGLDGMDEEARYRINVFDWEREFPGVLARGQGEDHGFDAVIGNPPYGAALDSTANGYLRSCFEVAENVLDTYALFIEQGLRLVRPDGLLAMIVSTSWYSGAAFSKLRRFVATNADPVAFVNLPYDVFAAWIDTSIFVVRRRCEREAWPRTAPCVARLRTFPKRHRILSADEMASNTVEAEVSAWFSAGQDEYLTYADTATTRLLMRLAATGRCLGDVADVQRGVTPFNLSEMPSIPASMPAFSGTVRRYRLERGPDRYIRFDATLKELKPVRYFGGPRLLVRQMISRQFRLQAAHTSDDFVTNKSMYSVLAADSELSLGLILAILNSKLMSWYFLTRSQVGQRDDFPKIVLRELRGLPMPSSEGMAERGASLVSELAEASLRLQLLTETSGGTSAPVAADLLGREIMSLDQRIDRGVYELFGLDPVDIAIVEA